MLEQVSTSVKFLAFFTASKQGKTGLTVTVDLYDPSGSQIVTGGSATAASNWPSAPHSFEDTPTETLIILS